MTHPMQRTLRSRTLAALLLAACAPACADAGTGDRMITFELQAESVPDGDRPLGELTTRTGWDVKLESAYIAVGAVYLFERNGGVAARSRSLGERIADRLVPPAHAHPGDAHFDGGAVKGEWLGQIVLDALEPGPVSLGDARGVAGEARSLTVLLDPPRSSLGAAARVLEDRYHAYVSGRAEKAGLPPVEFEGGLEIEDEGTKRRVEGIPVSVDLDDGVVVRLRLHLEAWFREASFETLLEPEAWQEPALDESPAVRRRITRDDQVGITWFIGARGSAAFSVEAERL